MAVSVRKITLWRSEVPNRPGMVAGALAALAEAGADLKVVMAYRFPGDESSGIPTLLVYGDDRPGVGAAIARGIAEAGINLAFFVAQVLGRRYSAVIGFDSEADAKKAAPLIKKAKPQKK